MNVKSLLVIFLAISIAAPTMTIPMFATTTHAASSMPVLPTVTAEQQVFEAGSSSATTTYTISNPLSGSAITSLSINVPKSISSGAPTITTADVSGVSGETITVYGTGPWVIIISMPSNGVLIPAGASIEVTYSFPAVSSLPSAGTVGATTPVSVTYSSGSSYAVSSPELYVTEAIGYTITGPTSSVEAGSNATFTISPIVPSGESVSWVPAFLTVTPPSGVKSSTVTAPTVVNATPSGTSFGVNATVASSSTYSITASGGTGSPSSGELPTSSPATTWTVVAGMPTKVTVGLSTDVSGYSTDYATGTVSTTISLTDAFNNPVTIPAGTVIIVTSSSGKLVNSTPASGTRLMQNVASAATSVAGPTFYPPVSYGSSSQLSATVIVPSTSPYAGTYSGTSNVVITSTNEVSSPVATILTSSPTAGQTIKAQVRLVFPSYGSSGASTTGQANVPVSFYVSTTKTPTYTAPSYATPMSGVVMTNSSGYATFSFVETSTSETVYVWTSIPQPVTGNPTAMLSNVSTTSGVTVSAGAPSALKIHTVPSTKYIAVNGTATIDVDVTDAYGNPVTLPSTSNAIQITLSASSGSLSATTVYITAGESDTVNSHYAVTYTAPATAGTVTLTASASGLTSGTLKLDVVTLYPLLGVTSPVSGKVVTTQNITVNAWAAPSPAAPTGTYISSFMYSLNGAANKSVAITSTNSSGYNFYAIPVTLSPGMNTIKLYATSSNGYTSEYTVTYTLSTVPPTPAQTIIFPTSAPPVETTVAGYKVINVTMYNNVSTTLTAIPVVVLSNSTFSWVAIGNPTTVSSGSTVISFVSIANIPAGTYTAKVFIVEPNGVTISGYKTFTVTVS